MTNILTDRQAGVSIGIHVPSVDTAGLADGAAYATFFREAEALGFDALWVEDRIFHPAPLADSVALLSWAAAHTTEMLLGSAVMMLNLRSAPIVARHLSTLQHLSSGRMVAGISLGGHPSEYAGLGLEMHHRVGRFRESVAILRTLLTGTPVTQTGANFPLTNAVIQPAAAIPLLIGGIADAAVRRAGELADGWIMGPFGGVDNFLRGRVLARTGAADAGKDPDALVYGRLLYVAVDDSPQLARASLAPFLQGYYGARFDIDQHAVFGTPDDVSDRLRTEIEAGVTHLMLGVPTLDLTHLRRLAHEVVSALR